jgi:hypothetical protein
MSTFLRRILREKRFQTHVFKLWKPERGSGKHLHNFHVVGTSIVSSVKRHVWSNQTTLQSGRRPSLEDATLLR